MATSKNTRQPTGHIAPFGLRLQPELKARAEESAARYGRSLNAEIVHVLQNHYDQQDREGRTVDAAIAEGESRHLDHVFPKYAAGNLTFHPSIPLVMTVDENNLISDLMQRQLNLFVEIVKKNNVPVSDDDSSNEPNAKPSRVSRSKRPSSK